jgi:hypothetical protein
MDKIKIVHDRVGKTLTVWLGDPKKEYSCDETADEMVIMKDKSGKAIGFEILNYASPVDSRDCLDYLA